MRLRVRELPQAVWCCAVAVTIAVVLAPPALACGVPDTSQPFSRWGDDADYVLMPGGSFEEAAGWSTIGSSLVVDADNPFEIGGQGARALRLDSGDSATSPSICIDRSYPHVRFVLRGQDATSKLKLSVLWTDARGRAMQEPLDDHDAKTYRAWGPSRTVRLKRALPRGEAIRDIRLRFWVEGKAGSWLIDDVYVDPYKRS